MSSRDRHKLARRTLAILFAALMSATILGLVGGTALNRMVSGVAEPPAWVFLPIGLSWFLMGLHHVYFRHEDAELESAWRRQWGLPGYGPWWCVLWGIAAMLVALCLMAVGIHAVIDGLR